MIQLTKQAAQAILKLHKERAQADQIMRLKVIAGGCSGLEYSMLFDLPQSDDISVDQEGVKVVVDPASMKRLEGVVIDFDDGLSGKGFEIRNPNAESTCGCGRSFN